MQSKGFLSKDAEEVKWINCLFRSYPPNLTSFISLLFQSICLITKCPVGTPPCQHLLLHNFLPVPLHHYLLHILIYDLRSSTGALKVKYVLSLLSFIWVNWLLGRKERRCLLSFLGSILLCYLSYLLLYVVCRIMKLMHVPTVRSNGLPLAYSLTAVCERTYSQYLARHSGLLWTFYRIVLLCFGRYFLSLPLTFTYTCSIISTFIRCNVHFESNYWLSEKWNDDGVPTVASVLFHQLLLFLNSKATCFKLLAKCREQLHFLLPFDLDTFLGQF